MNPSHEKDGIERSLKELLDRLHAASASLERKDGLAVLDALPELDANLRRSRTQISLKLILAILLDRMGVTQERSLVVLPPGLRLRSILGFIYSGKTMARVFDPILADMQAEWLEASVAGAQWKARWVRVRGYHSLATAAGLYSVLRLLKRAVGLWRAF